VTDLKQYQYCRVILYYHLVPAGCPARYIKWALELKRTKKNSGAPPGSLAGFAVEAGTRHFDVPIKSSILGLTGW